MDFGKCRVVDVAKIDAADLGTECASDGLHVNTAIAGHGIVSSRMHCGRFGGHAVPMD
jgi:hypothetical protein